MPYVVQAPSRELSRLAGRLEWAFVAYASAQGVESLAPEWEAPRYAWTLSKLIVRHAEATTLMARTDVAHAPSAWVTARACVETAARSLWLLDPDGEWEREARWLAFLKEGARLGKQEHVSWLQMVVDRSQQISGFANAVESKLPDGIVVPTRIPTTHQMLAPLDPALDAFYAIASQFTHGAEYATGMFRSNLGTDAIFGEGSSEADWIIPLRHVWQAFRATSVRLFEVGGTNAASEQLLLADEKVKEAFQAFIDVLDLPDPDPDPEQSVQPSRT